MFSSSVLALCAILALLFLTFTHGQSGDAESVKTEGMSRNKRIGVETATLLAGAISAGASLTGTGATALMNTGYSVTIGIEIENYSKWIMADPTVYNDAGYVSTPPQPVHPAKREMMVAHKTGYTATGTYGTVSWNIQGTRPFVMWSAPYSFDFDKNWLGVGILPRGAKHEESLFDDVYYPWEDDLFYTKDRYYKSIKTIHHCDEVLCITGTMGTSHKPQAHIKVYPLSYEDLAPTVKSTTSSGDYQAFLDSNGYWYWGF